jgi:L-alanine-DL-glutamate epimerase-like enolase superfamily enzyme
VRIDRVTHERVEVALHETFRTAIRETNSIEAIRIVCQAGDRVGVGYATATPAITGDTVQRIESLIDDVVGPYLVGRDIAPQERSERGSSGADGSGEDRSGRADLQRDRSEREGSASDCSERDGSARDCSDRGSSERSSSERSSSQRSSSERSSSHRDDSGRGSYERDSSGREGSARAAVFGAQSSELFGIADAEYQSWTALCSSGTAGIDLALHDFLYPFPVTQPASITTSVTIGAGSVEEMVATAHRRVTAGFRVVKAKLGADPAWDAHRLIALAQALGAVRDPSGSVRAAVGTEALPLGPVQFWIDANQGWTVAQALAIFDAALDANVVLGAFEQPTPAADVDALREVRLGVREICLSRGVDIVPVVADESARTLADIDRIIAAEAADVINVKFMKFGGITGSAMAVGKARSAGLGVLVGSMMEHPHSVAAAVRFVASLGEARGLGVVHDLDAGWWAGDASPLRYESGIVSVMTESDTYA